MAKTKDRPAPRVIEPRHPNSPRYYEWDSESEPGRKHRTMVYNGEVKGCTCRGAKHGCWHQQYAARLEHAIRTESSIQEEDVTKEKTTTAVAVAKPQLPSTEVQAPTPGVGALLPSPAQFDLMWRMAQTAKNAGAGMLPDNIKTPEAAMAVMLAGYELGFPPFAALRQVFIVNGKTQLMSEGLYALMKQRDPSLEVEWHERSTTGAEASLWRHGKEIIRIRYDESDRQRAHQGERLKFGGDGKPQRDAKGVKQYWPMDSDSPWAAYPRDMFAWAVLKRLQRFGAPELVNLAPMLHEPPEDDTFIEPPRTPLSSAIAEGKVPLVEAATANEVPDPEGDPDVPPSDEAPPLDEVPAGDFTDINPDEPEQEEAADDPSEPVWASWQGAALTEQKAKLHDRLVRAKKAMLPKDYGDMARGIARDFCGDEKNLNLDAMGAEQVYEAINRTVLAEGGDVGLYWGETV